MFTFSFIKHAAKSLDKDDIEQGKSYASRYGKRGLWYAYDCAEHYQRFMVSKHKVSWWYMVVQTLRYANDNERKKWKEK